jgi:retron-type reverse transcriptase
MCFSAAASSENDHVSTNLASNTAPAVDRVARAIVQKKTRVIDIDLRSYFDNVRHDRLLAKVARRVDDADVMHLLKLMLKANGRRGVPQGGVISPLLSNLYLNEVDNMLERAKETSVTASTPASNMHDLPMIW